jgi:hypothetical protein
MNVFVIATLADLRQVEGAMWEAQSPPLPTPSAGVGPFPVSP